MRGWWLLASALAACSGADTSPNVGGSNAPTPPVEGTIPRATVERDLVLELKRTSTVDVDRERAPDLEVWLVNRSATASYPVVLANDGSEVGWREPKAFFALERQRPSGAWEPLHEQTLRCGLYAQDWTQDVVTLAPGERVKMKWMPYPLFDIDDATRVRVTAHYEYGEHARDKSKVPPLLHPMPSYALTSAAMEIPVEHPYGLTLKLKGPLPTKPGADLASSVDVVVENRSSRALPVTTYDTNLWFAVQFESKDDEPSSLSVEMPFRSEPPSPQKEMLAAGGHTSIVTREMKTDSMWSLPSPERKVVRMRAFWRINEHNGDPNHTEPRQRRVESPWVDVP